MLLFFFSSLKYRSMISSDIPCYVAACDQCSSHLAFLFYEKPNFITGKIYSVLICV